MRFGLITLNPASISFGQLVLGNGRQEPRGRPSLSIGLFGKLRPQGP